MKTIWKWFNKTQVLVNNLFFQGFVHCQHCLLVSLLTVSHQGGEISACALLFVCTKLMHAVTLGKWLTCPSAWHFSQTFSKLIPGPYLGSFACRDKFSWRRQLPPLPLPPLGTALHTCFTAAFENV